MEAYREGFAFAGRDKNTIEKYCSTVYSSNSHLLFFVPGPVLDDLVPMYWTTKKDRSKQLQLKV